MAQHEVYVAFSIHGTNTFITANKMVDLPFAPAAGASLTIDGLQFKVGASRTKSKNGGIKLLADVLLMKSGKPITDPRAVQSFFDKLRIDHGWKVDDKAFKKKHAKQLTDATVEASVAASTPAIDDKQVEQQMKSLEQTEETNVDDGSPEGDNGGGDVPAEAPVESNEQAPDGEPKSEPGPDDVVTEEDRPVAND